MEGRGRSRAKKKAKFFSPKRLTSFLLAAAMVCTNIGSDLSTAYAAGTSSEVTFEMRGADLTAAVEEAIVSENVVTPDDLNFTNGKVDDFKGYLFGEGKLYEAYPEMEGGDVEADMRVFVRLPEDANDMYAVTGDEEVIFLYINNSDETVRFRSRINYMVDGEEKVKQTDSVTVRSYESIFGDEEVNVISDPAEEIPETTVPETETGEVPETPAEDPVATESEMTVSMSPNAAALVSAPGEEATPSEWPEDETDAEVPETTAPEETTVPAEEEPAAEETTEVAETIPAATPSETPAATDSEIENAPKPSYSDIVGIGWSGTAKIYASTLNKLHALDDVEGWKVGYSIAPEGSARIVDGARGVEDGEDLYFGVKNQIGYAVETVLANGEELTADTITDNEDGSQTAWYAVYGVAEEQSIDVVMAETGEHPAFEQTLVMDDGMQISIKAEAGVLPVGVEATAERVSQEVEAAVVESASAEGKTLTSVYAYDINLWLNGQLLDSEIWGGSKRVQVTFSGDPVKEASEQASAVEVLHVETVQDTDQEAKEKAAVQEEEIKAEDVLGIETVSEVVEVPAEESVDAVSFEAEHFTVYAVAAYSSQVYTIRVEGTQTLSVNTYNVTWQITSQSSENVISLEEGRRGEATVTGKNPGTAVVKATWRNWLGSTETQEFTIIVTNENSYLLYCYGLVPGMGIDDNVSVDKKWMGLGVGTISGENLNAPSSYPGWDNGNVTTLVTDYDSYTLPDIPSITVDGKTYEYAEPDSPQATQEGYYTIDWIRVVATGGANTGANEGNPVVNSGTATFHLDGQILLNEKDKYNVSFRIQQPGEDYFQLQENYSVLVDAGTSEASLLKPETLDKNLNGVTYKFDGWYYDEECTQKANFNETITQNTIYYGKYVADEEEVTVYIYGNTAEKVYTGSEQQVADFITSELPDGITVSLKNSATAVAKGTDVGSYLMGLTTDMFTVEDNNPGIKVKLEIAQDGQLTITPRPVTITAASETFTYDGQSHSNDGYEVSKNLVGEDELTAEVEGSITYPGSVLNKVVSHKFTTGDFRNYTVTYVDGTLKMEYGEQIAITIKAEDESWTYDGTAHSNAGVKITSGELLEGDVLEATASGSVTNVADNAKDNNTVNEGYRIMNGETDVTGKYAITVEAGTLTINPRPVTITAASETFTYDGQSHSNDNYKVNNLVGEDELTAEVEGSITYPGSVPNKVVSHKFTTGDFRNYTVTYVDGTLKMEYGEQIAITIKAEDESWTYDGTAHSNAGVKITSGELLEGDVLEATASGSVTNVADNAKDNNTVNEGYRIMNGETDVTGKYAITVEAGTLTINPRPVTITAASETFTYDGQSHSNDGYEVSKNLVGEDELTAEVEGSITYPGSVPNKVVSHKFTTGDFRNYTVTYVDGTLKMEYGEQIAITIKAEDESWTYDGTAHSNAGVKITSGELLEGDVLEATASGSVTNVADNAEDNNTVNEGYRIMNGEMDVTGKYAITVEAGTLTINPRPVTITAGSKEFTYTGEAQSYGEFAIGGDGMADGESLVDVEVTGSITYPSESPVTNEITHYDFGEGTLEENYTIKKVAGELTMKYGDQIELTVIADDGEWVYDGTPHSQGTYTYGGNLVSGDELTVTITGSATNVSDTGTSNVVESVTVTNNGHDVTEKYDITTWNGVLTITPFEVLVKADDTSKTYGESDPEFTATVSPYHEGEVKPDDGYEIQYDSEFARQPGEDAGEYTIFAGGNTVQAGGNYKVYFENGTLTINQAHRPTEGETAVAVEPYEGVYDANSHTITVSNLLDGDKVQYSYDGGETWEDNLREYTDVTELPIHVKVTNPNYTEDEIIVESHVIITQKPVTVTADSKSKVYGTSDPELTASVDGTLNGDQVEYTVQRNAGEAVGTYEIIPNGEASQGNYHVFYKSGVFTITPADREKAVSVTNYSGQYDAEAHTITVNGTVEGDVLQYSYDGGETWEDELRTYTNVTNGVEQILVQVTNPNYESVENLIGTVYIWPKKVTVTAQDNSKVYGTDDPELTAVEDGLLGDDTIAYDIARATGEEAGTYPIYVLGEELQGNYQVEYIKGIFTITAAQRTEKIKAQDYIGVYDGQPHTISVIGLVDGDRVEYSYDGGQTWYETLEQYTDVTPGTGITVRVTNLNYYPTEVYATAEVVITPFEMLVKADDTSKTYGESDPEFTATVSPYHEGEVKPDDGYEIQYDSEFARQPGEDAGEYTIFAGGNTVQAGGNYKVYFENGTLIINQAHRPTEGETAVAVEPYEGVYDANSHTITVSNLLDGDKVQYSYDGGVTWEDDLREYTDVTALPIHVKVTNPNYAEDEITLGSYVIITQKPVTVTADSKSKVYGTSDPELTASVDGTLNGDQVEYTVQRNAGEAVGTYEIIPDGEASQGNYHVFYKSGVFTITPADREKAVSVTNYSGQYDAEAHTITVNGTVEGDVLQYSYDGGETWEDELRTYTDVTADPQAIYVRVTNPNYEEIPALVGTVMITPVSVTVTAQDNGKLYGTEDPLLEAVVSGTLEGEEDLVQYTVTRAYGETVGTYPIYAAGDALQGNYQITYVNAEFVIRGGIVYDGNGNTTGTAPVDENSYYTGDTITVLDKADLAKEDALFLGWSFDKLPVINTAEEEAAVALIQPADVLTMGDKGITLYAVWAKDATGPDDQPDDKPDYEEFSVFYHANGGEGTMTDSRLYPEGFEYTVKENEFLREKFAFDGWNTVADGTGEAVAAGQVLTLTADVNLYAQWAVDEIGETDPNLPDGIPDKYQVTFTYVSEDESHGIVTGKTVEVITRRNEDGSLSETTAVSPTVSVTITENGRYRFDHWTDAAGTEYTTEELRNATFTADATFTAHFRYISSSGGNGGGSGSSGGTGPYTPSTGGPGAAIIGDNDVPLAPLPTENNGGNVVIFDDSVPLAPLPKTGQQSSKAPVTMLLTGIFLMFASLKRRKEEKQ